MKFQRRLYKTVRYCILIISISLLSISLHHSLKKEDLTIDQGFKAYSIKDRKWGTCRIKKNFEKTILFIFSSTCELCLHEMDQVALNIDSFNDTQLLFVSYESIDNLSRIKKKHHLFSLDRVLLYHCPYDDMYSHFGSLINSVPKIMIYNSKGQMTKLFDRATSIEKLLSEI